MNSKILKGVEQYYSQKISEHGDNSLGVDWNSKESQYLRFEQLSKLFNNNNKINMLDYGCGYGEYINFLNQNFGSASVTYTGYDVSELMLATGKHLFEHNQNISFTQQQPTTKFDYTIASGVFNVKLDLATNEEWLQYILNTLDTINNLSEKGFAFNLLTKYSDKEFIKAYLYYADPLFLFHYCKENFSRNVALLHDYGLYEFTLIVRK